jgi:hypothetical protein
MKTWAELEGEGSGVVCVVCHAEGGVDANGAATLSGTYHNKPVGVVDLYDGRNRSTIYSINLTALKNHADANHDTENSDFDTFCMSCHRSGGASAVAGAGFPAGYTAANPFGETTNILTNSYDQVQKSFVPDVGGLAVYESFYPGTGPGANSQDNHHAVRGARYSGTLLRDNSFLSATVALFDGTAGVADNKTLHCNDCHSTAYSAHGGYNEYLLQLATVEDPGPTDTTDNGEHTTASEYVCNKCHINGAYPEGGGNHTGNTSEGGYHSSQNTGSNRASSSAHIIGMTCANCHDGAVVWGGIHGFADASYTAGQDGAGQGTYWKRRFLPGSSLLYYDPYTGDGDPADPNAGDTYWGQNVERKCYTLGAANSISACKQHGKGSRMSVACRHHYIVVSYRYD